jgi:ribosomal protein S8
MSFNDEISQKYLTLRNTYMLDKDMLYLSSNNAANNFLNLLCKDGAK